MNTKSHNYSETTRDICVSVLPQYLPDQSVPEDHRYVWAYTVRIENQGAETVQLINRYWRITDAQGTSHEVRGEGVIGEQPVLAPGEAFEYTSGTPLATPSPWGPATVAPPPKEPVQRHRPLRSQTPDAGIGRCGV